MPIVVPGAPAPPPPSPGTVAMVAMSVFYPYILHSTLGAPEPLVDLMLLNTAIEFCDETNCVQIMQPAIDSVADQAEYTITPPTDLQLARVMSVWYERTKLPAVPSDLVDEPLAYRSPIATTEAPTGTPQLFYQQEPGAATIKLWPVPSQSTTGAISVRAVFKPAIDATTLPAILQTTWAKGFTAGVRAALHSIPNQVWTDSGRAAVEMAEYTKTLRDATIKTNLGKARGPLRVRAHPLF